MRKLILIFLALVPNIVFAKWVTAATGYEVVYFYDPSRIYTVHGLTKDAWILGDYPKPEQTVNKQMIRSTIEKRRFFCATHEMAILKYVDYSGRMGTGNVVRTADLESFKISEVVPNSVGEKLLEAICEN